MKKLFGGLRMKWLTVLLFAAAAGIYTGLVMLIPWAKDTSLQDIGISYEWWVVFAVIIVTNCKKPLEAALKCFAFFLISQPLVYLTEILFGSLTLPLAKSYYFATWLPLTFATLPGGLIAWFCKKQNAGGAIVLGLGCTIELALGAYYLKMAAAAPVQHLLSGLFCFAAIVVMVQCIQEKKKNRIIAYAVPAALTALLFVLARITGRTFL